jgi:hypothetical protein
MIGAIAKLPVMVQAAPCFETRSISPSRRAWGGAPPFEERHAGGASAFPEDRRPRTHSRAEGILAGKIGCQ